MTGRSMLKSKSLTYALGPPVVMRISGAWKASSAAESGWIGTASRLQHRIARTRTQNIAIFARFPPSFGRRKNTQKEKRFEIVRGENINREKLLRREKQRNGSRDLSIGETRPIIKPHLWALDCQPVKKLFRRFI